MRCFSQSPGKNNPDTLTSFHREALAALDEGHIMLCWQRQALGAGRAEGHLDGIKHSCNWGGL